MSFRKIRRKAEGVHSLGTFRTFLVIKSLGIQEKWKHLYTQSCNLETTQMSINRQIDKINAAYSYYRLLVSNKKEWTIDTTWMNLKTILLAEKVMNLFTENF